MLRGSCATAIFLVSVAVNAQPEFRFTNPIRNLKISPQGRFLAYTTQNADSNEDLSILDLKTTQIYSVSDHQIGPAFFWSPEGFRLFYRELSRGQEGTPVSTFKTYDCFSHLEKTIETLPSSTGYLTFNPKDLRIYTMAETAIHLVQILYPDSRLAKWQTKQRAANGTWVVTQNGVLWSTYGGTQLAKLADDDTGVASFATSPDGRVIAWSTTKGTLFVSEDGQAPQDFGPGKDPAWHPDKKLLVYKAGRAIGKVAHSYDLRVVNMKKRGRWLTQTPYSNERWPNWHPQKKNVILYTIENTSDLYTLDLNHEQDPPGPLATRR